MPDRRKLRREFDRVRRQLAAIPAVAEEYLLATRRHDRDLRPLQLRTAGAVPRRDKAAVFVIFPRHGVQSSHLQSLRYIASRGYSPVTVSNLPLEAADRNALAELSTLLIERSNFGYDFGAYREGVLSLADDLPRLRRLVLLNDSCWFPLPGSRDWLTLAEESGFDYAGAASNYAIDPPDVARFESLSWSQDRTRRSFHYCSFAISLSAALIADPAFLRFWRGFRLSDVKSRTVRRGEIGLTQWAIRRGHRHGSIFDVDHLDRDLARLDDAALRRHVGQVIIPEHTVLRDMFATILADDAAGMVPRRTLEKLFLMAVARQGMAYTIPGYLHETAGYPFLKKSPVWLDPVAREQTIRFVEGLGAEASGMLAEIAAIVRDRGLDGGARR
ncbi:rhamnan synthesis F family protein [Aquibium microcysteis]|uniref:rhamnan synthesis F family protein n=1 Tax=Aquibium microcysteis TaxID=675281 RepID=UPI001AEEBC6E|nr:rhamnan synthesis F family protein [Aquibium microcysteis]